MSAVHAIVLVPYRHYFDIELFAQKNPSVIEKVQNRGILVNGFPCATNDRIVVSLAPNFISIYRDESYLQPGQVFRIPPTYMTTAIVGCMTNISFNIFFPNLIPI